MAGALISARFVCRHRFPVAIRVLNGESGIVGGTGDRVGHRGFVFLLPVNKMFVFALKIMHIYIAMAGHYNYVNWLKGLRYTFYISVRENSFLFL